MMPVMVEALLDSIQLLSGASRTFTERCVVGIEANEDRIRALLERNPSIATALNPYIGYDEAAKVAKESARRAVSVREVVQERDLLPADQLDEALDVRAMTEPGLPE